MGNDGVNVLRDVVPQDAVDRTLRRLHLDVAERGLPSEELGSWLWSAHWFPHLKWHEDVVSLLDHVPAELREGELCDPQIVLQLPDADPDAELTPHVDREPEWAGGRRYRRIVGVALGPNRERNGGLVVWPLGGGDARAVELEAGDVVVMDPDLPHTSGLNREGAIRYCVYFRFLEPAA